MRASAKRFYSLLVSIVLLVGALFVYSSFIIPEYGEIQRLRGEREGKSKLLTEYKDTAEALSNLLSKYKNVSQLQATLSLTLPLSEEVPQVFNQLQGLAGASDLKIDSMSFQYLPIDYSRGSLFRPVGTLRIAMRFAGTYERFKEFLKAVETNVRILDVSFVSIEGGAIGKNPLLNYNLIVDTYYQAEK